MIENPLSCPTMNKRVAQTKLVWAKLFISSVKRTWTLDFPIIWGLTDQCGPQFQKFLKSSIERGTQPSIGTKERLLQVLVFNHWARIDIYRQTVAEVFDYHIMERGPYRHIKIHILYLTVDTECLLLCRTKSAMSLNNSTNFKNY